jgi:adapter protein MecA 1/2
MRIEKISEKQFRCTLNQKDLKDREIGISELAYGTAKAKALFRDMMQQASYELGFDTDDIPLMIEAIPLLPEALVLVVTKVEEPDELDTRFSCFTEELEWEEDEDAYLYDDFEAYDDEDYEEILSFNNTGIMDNEPVWKFPKEQNTSSNPTQTQHASSEPDFISLPEALGMEPRPREDVSHKVRDIVTIFAFSSLDAVIKLACHIHTIYHGENTLYKDTTDGTYYLVMHRSNQDAEEFNKVGNILYEYGTLVKNSAALQYYFEEHFTPVITQDAIDKLAKI